MSPKRIEEWIISKTGGKKKENETMMLKTLILPDGVLASRSHFLSIRNVGLQLLLEIIKYVWVFDISQEKLNESQDFGQRVE